MYDLGDCPACREGAGLMMNEGGWCAYVECSDCGAHTAHFAGGGTEGRPALEHGQGGQDDPRRVMYFSL